MGSRAQALIAALALFGCGNAEVATDRCPAPASSTKTPLARGDKLMLHDGWSLRSSAGLGADGATLSTSCFAPGSDWNPASVPSTVVAALVADGVYTDPEVGMNLRDIPGTDYGIGLNYSNFPMPDDSPFAPSWWYRLDFELPPSASGDHTLLHFDGINYKANIWLNGTRIAASDDVQGIYRRYEFDVTGVAKPGRHNVLAVEVTRPEVNDLSDTFIDWNPMPADKNMGIWQAAYVTTSGPVTVRHPMATSKISAGSAALTVEAELENRTSQTVRSTLVARVGDVAGKQDVALAAHERRAVKLPLVLPNPKLWWPYQLGEPYLYDLSLDVTVDGKTSDTVTRKFGVREVTDEMTKDEHVIFSVNGQRILVRGAGYTSDMMLRFDDDRDALELGLVKDMGLNAIRLEGKLADDHLLDVADREGVLVIAGWECCNIWQLFSHWTSATKAVAKASLEDQIYRLRGHPSLLTWWNGSDLAPSPEMEQAYLDVEKAEDWPNPVQASADELPSKVSGPTGVKMTGPYDYVPPIYWYADIAHGGAFGFNTETSPGPGIPSVESIEKFIPKDHLWPPDDVWWYHCGGPPFDRLTAYVKAMDARYGKASSLADFVTKAQALDYDGERAMFEAFRRNKYTSTGVVQWMLNDAWPSFIWHLYDFYLSAGGGYYGTKKANEPVHIQYSYDNQSVVVVNDLHQAFPGMKASVTAYGFDLTKTFTQQKTLDVPEDSSTVVTTIPDQSAGSTTWFVKLVLTDSAGKPASDNFYWLSTKPDQLDFPNTTYQYTPTLQHGDLTQLDALPELSLQVSAKNGDAGPARTTSVTVANPSGTLAFMVELRLVKGKGGGEVLPSTWSDDFFTLLPGETRTVTASYADAALDGATPAVHVQGWNVAATDVVPQ